MDFANPQSRYPFPRTSSRLLLVCALVLAAQLAPWIPQAAITAGSAAVLFIAGASGCDYVLKWSARALQQRRKDN